MSNNSLNNLIGNFVTVTQENTTILESNMVSIDTSNGFLGFNTIDPSYNIDICNGTIRTKDAIITNNLKLLNIPNESNLSTLELGTIYLSNEGSLKIKT